MTCGWACTGCDWRVSSPRSAPPTCASPSMRRERCSRRPAIPLPEPALKLLHERTEGWAAGLRLAALSLAGHPDPARFAAEFSGSERTVAEYLLAEVLERQPEEVRRLLLRTSVLERVNGELADLLTGGSGGERILQQLEQANAFVVVAGCPAVLVPLPPAVRRPAAAGATGHRAGRAARAARRRHRWYADHGYPVEAVRHAQAAEDWGLAARLLSDHWVGLGLGGLGATAYELLARFPADVIAADAELAARMAGVELFHGSLEQAERYLTVATQGLASVPADRRGRSQVILAVVRMRFARQRGDLPAVAEQAQRLLAPAEAADAGAVRAGRGPAGAGVDQPWHRRGLGRAARRGRPAPGAGRRPGAPDRAAVPRGHRPGALGAAAAAGPSRSGRERSRQAIELAGRHGWATSPSPVSPTSALGVAMVGPGATRGGRTVRSSSAERTLRTEVEPAAGMRLHYGRGMLEFVSGRHDAALGAFRTAERLAERARHRAHARQEAAVTRAANAGAAGRDTARRTGPRGDGRRSVTAERCATPPRRFGSPRPTRRRPRPRSRPSSTAPFP